MLIIGYILLYGMGDSGLTLNQYIYEWLYVKKISEVKPATFSSIVAVYQRYIEPSKVGERELTENTDIDIQLLLNNLLSKGLSISVIKKVRDLLGAVYKYAYAKGDVGRNPVLLVKTPHISLRPPKEVVILTVEQVRRLDNEIKRTYSTGAPVWYYGEAFNLMLNTGVRPCELLGLMKSDVDSESRTLSINRNIITYRNYVTGKNETIIQNTLKTKKSRRSIYLNNKAIQSIDKLVEYQKCSSDFLVSSKNGGYLEPQQLRRTFYRMLENADIPKNNLYCLRHTFASLLFSKGVDLKTVSEILGHASIRITADTYIHFILKTSDSTKVLDEIYTAAKL